MKDILKIINFSAYIVVIGFALLLSNCATRGAPGGGPPDKTGPEIIRTYPSADSVLVDSLLEYVEIEFSEPVLEAAFKQSLFISPPLKIEIDWQNAEIVRLLLRDTLLSEQTYVVTVGAGATDEHNNKMKNSYSFAFSTGRKIDQGGISGNIYDLTDNQTAAVFAYLLNDSIPIDPTRRKPLYVSQSGINGSFSLNYLKEGCYRVFAVEDMNNNLLYDMKYERIGIPYRDACTDSLHPRVSSMDFHLNKRDTIPPDLVGARAINNHTIRLRLSEPVQLPDSAFVVLTDSIKGTPLPVLSWYADEEEKNNVNVYTQTMDTGAFYRIKPYRLTDLNGNTNTVPVEKIIPASVRQDTSRFRLMEFIPADSAKNVHPEEVIVLKFSRPTNWESVAESFLLITSGGDTITGDWRANTALKADFVPQYSLQSDSSYTAILRTGTICDLWGEAAKDSTIRHVFTVISNRELGEIAGEVIWSSGREAPVFLYIRKIGQKEGEAQALYLEKPGPFYKKALLPGMYLLDAFVDVNLNGSYDYGSYKPFEYAEPFHFSNDTLRVRKRWETSGVRLIIPVQEEKP